MTTDLQRNLVVIEPAPGLAVDLGAIPAAIEAAGYRSGRMWLRARGRPTSGGDGFAIDGWPQPLSMEPLPMDSQLDSSGGVVDFEVVREGQRVVLRPNPADHPAATSSP